MPPSGLSAHPIRPPARPFLAAALAAVGLVLGAACATRVLPDIAVVPLDGWEYAEARSPAPAEALGAEERSDLAATWDAIRAGRLAEAAATLEALRPRAPNDPGVLAVAGYGALRAGRASDADALFAEALAREPANAFAALGRYLVALATGAEDAGFARLRALAAIDPEAPAAADRLAALTLETAERRLAAARELAGSGAARSAAVAAYRDALDVIPDSGDLLLEAAGVAAAASDRAAAREWFTAASTSPGATPAQVAGARLSLAELLADEGRADESLATLDELRSDPAVLGSEALGRRVAALEARLEVARLSAAYDRIREAERVTREQLAALLAGELGDAAGDGEAALPVIAIDLEGSWAISLIRRALTSGYLTLFPDHTFKPRAYVDRATLAEALAAALDAHAPGGLEQARRNAARREFTDLASSHRSRRAAALAIELEMMRTDGTRFRPREFASGADAVRAVGVLRDLVGARPSG